jgi:hypothetical protein
MANRVFSVAAVVFGASALMSSLAVTPAAAWTYHRHRYAPAHYVTVHPVYRYGYHAARTTTTNTDLTQLPAESLTRRAQWLSASSVWPRDWREASWAHLTVSIRGMCTTPLGNPLWSDIGDFRCGGALS